MSNEVFAQIRSFKQQGNFVEAWNCGISAFQNEPNNTFLRTSLFWICYAAIKSVQAPILQRQNKAPNDNEQQIVNSWINCIGQLNLPIPCEELDFRFFNLFKGCGEHYQTYINMLIFYGSKLFQKEDLVPFKMEKGEYPSLAVRLARQTSKAWLQHHNQWQLDIEGVLSLLNFANDKAQDRNKTWLQFDISKCLVGAGRYNEAREAALTVLRKKMSESWAWGALAETYVEEDSNAAITCYCKGIKEAHEPPFCIPMYFGLAKLFAASSDFENASASLCKLIEIYNANGWALKPEHEEFVQQAWFDASAAETNNLQILISEKSDKALQYATAKLETVFGVVDSHHRSGKGFSIYVDLDNKLSARKGVFFGKDMPEVGSWVEVKYAVEQGKKEAMEVHLVENKQHKNVEWIEDIIKVNPKGFAFVGDAFIPPFLVDQSLNGKPVKVLKVWDKDPKKGTPSWRAIKLIFNYKISS